MNQVGRHYGRTDLLESILRSAQALGKNIDALTPADLASVDQFHIGGVDVCPALAALGGFGASMHVLDVGGGLGGPARWLASTVGCSVTVVDLTPEYGETGRELTRRCGLAERVRFECADARRMPFDDRSFDAAWTQHSSMNVDDKASLYREIHRVLRPGARLVLYEIMRGPEAPLHFPVPWARDPSISFLEDPDVVRRIVAEAGFREHAWNDVTEPGLEWVEKRVAAVESGVGPLSLALLLGSDFPAMFKNLVRNMREGRQRIVQALFERAAI